MTKEEKISQFIELVEDYGCSYSEYINSTKGMEQMVLLSKDFNEKRNAIISKFCELLEETQ